MKNEEINVSEVSLEELKLWFSYLLGFYESKNGSVEKCHPALADIVRRLGVR